MAIEHIALANDWEYAYTVTTRDAATGEWEPATIVPPDAWISADPSGAAINAALRLTTVERAGLPGSYYAVLDGDLISTHLASYIGKTVYEVFGDDGNILRFRPLRVTLTQRFT
jgi:hypothetical protein